MSCTIMNRYNQSFPSQHPNNSSNREAIYDHDASPVYPPVPAMGRTNHQQVAYPIRSQSTYPVNATSQPYWPFTLEEHTLRRKTPRGTINGGYESNSHEMHAAKHIALPRDDVPLGYGPFPQLDSVLNQSTHHQLHHHQYYGQTVPSVNQPSFQYLGPTASGIDGRGPYGPYWNDGTYVPYRPAALRDPRFYSTLQSNDRWGPSVSYGRHASWQSGKSTPLAYPAASTRAGSWPTLKHGDLALPHAYASPATAGLLEDSKPVSGDDRSINYAPTSAQHREQTFHWALQIYRDLLTHIQQERKQKQPPASQPQPSFYPRPPKLSGAPFSSLVSHELDSISDVESSRYNGNTAPSSHSLLPHDSRADRSMQPPSAYQTYPTVDLRRPTASIAAAATSSHQDNSPPSRAMIALGMLSKLCQGTDWKWIDGMHLGGCLDYGLGNYAKAQRWYSKVLELDPRHLEAMSNLAATLLLLGHKDEAEEHWRRVIKDAPSHFEAVEHLVGLLCQTQRAKDAVKIIDHVQSSLRLSSQDPQSRSGAVHNDSHLHSSRSHISDAPERPLREHAIKPGYFVEEPAGMSEPGFGSSGYAIPGSDNGRILSLIHAKGNMLYSMGDNMGAAKTFEDAVLLAVGRHLRSIQDLVRHIISTIKTQSPGGVTLEVQAIDDSAPVLLYPDQAAHTARLCFPHHGDLAGLRYVPSHPKSVAKAAAIATTSNSLLSLAKIFQDNMSIASKEPEKRMLGGVKDILAIYYLSLSLQPSPSTANNIGIMLAGVQQSVPMTRSMAQHRSLTHNIPGVAPGSGIALALAYYNYGLMLDSRHAHLYTNLGSLLKDIGQLDAAIEMYKSAVQCDAKFDIALANLANAVKDKGRISDAIEYYKRAVDVNPGFAEAVCGLANALNSVCAWQGRGGISDDGPNRDRWHVNAQGMLVDGTLPSTVSSGWIKRVLDIVEKQLVDGETWGRGVLTFSVMEAMIRCLTNLEDRPDAVPQRDSRLSHTLQSWAGKKSEGARITRLVERATKRISWQWYQDKYVKKKHCTASTYLRPRLPAGLQIPHAPTVLPFHTFTAPMSAKQIRLISQRNGYRISASTLRMPWLPTTVYPPPAPPNPYLKVGYVSSDFNNHPLAHLMQSVFGLHDPARVQAICYATTASDNSVHRRQIESEAPGFHDVSSWSSERIVKQIVDDGCHILVNLNGYTRGARNDVFAARPAPVQMSFMGFAGTLGAEWCDYLLADETAVPPSSLRPWRRNVDVEDVMVDGNDGGIENGDKTQDEWVYGENLIYCRDTFFCCDHKQSAPDSRERRISWDEEQTNRWRMRKELFPTLADDAVIFANFNQLYKIDPTTFRTWLRILSSVPNSILWLLRFPDLGESHLLSTATLWAGPAIASRIIFTDVAPKHLHIARAKAADLFLDTPECNAHTTAADCLWSGTPLLTLPRWEYKMCSRMAASILLGALPSDDAVARAAATRDLIAGSEDEYEELAVKLGRGLRYPKTGQQGFVVGRGEGRLVELRRMLVEARWRSALFDTGRWVRDLEDAMEEVWERWVKGEGGDVYLKDVPVGGRKAHERELARDRDMTR